MAPKQKTTKINDDLLMDLFREHGSDEWDQIHQDYIQETGKGDWTKIELRRRIGNLKHQKRFKYDEASNETNDSPTRETEHSGLKLKKKLQFREATALFTSNSKINVFYFP